MSRVSEAADAFAEEFRLAHHLPTDDIRVRQIRNAWLRGFDSGVQALWNRVLIFDNVVPIIDTEIKDAIAGNILNHPDSA